ncbi:MAG: DoxX family protein [Anaerolineales bacterium]|jgi:putative oxidoreductase|nr:DoxX family protein [Anaerolineales bacterium]
MIDVGILILRISLGIVLIPHGVYKFQKKQFFDKKWREEYGLPVGSVLLTGIVQIVGGLAIILGIFPRLSALIQILIMLVATWISIRKHGEPFLSTPEGKGWDVNFLLIGALIALILLGSGGWSILGW